MKIKKLIEDIRFSYAHGFNTLRERFFYNILWALFWFILFLYTIIMPFTIFVSFWFFLLLIPNTAFFVLIITILQYVRGDIL